jgi:hypothetical protein
LEVVMRRALLWPLGSMALAFVLLQPVLETGYLSDDSANSSITGIIRYHDFTLAGLITDECRGYLAQGRFFPMMVIIARTIFHILPGLLAYKIYLVVSVLLNLLLFAGLLRRITGSITLAAIGVLTTAALFQFRFYHDPILSFHGFMQFVMTGTLLSLWSLDRFLTGGSRWWLAGAVFFYVPVLLTYEITYTFFLLHLALILARGRSWNAAALIALPFLSAAVSCAAVPFILRTFLGSTPGEAYSPSSDFPAIGKAYAKQLISAFPLSSYLNYSYFVMLRLTRLLPLLLVTFSAFLLARALLRRLSQERPEGGIGARGLALLGLLLWMLPGLPIALSPKYQAELRLGLGYLPVYAQYFGVGLLLLAGIVWGSRYFQRPALPKIATLVFALILGHHYAANVSLVRMCNGQRGIRENVEDALAAGLLDNVPEDAVLLLDHAYPLWQLDDQAYGGVPWSKNFSEYFYYLHTGKKLRTVVRGSPLSSTLSANTEVYELCDVFNSPRSGYVLLMHRKSLSTQDADHVRVSIRGKNGPAAFLVTGRQASRTGESLSIPGRDLAVLGRKHRATICVLPQSCGPILADSLTLTDNGQTKSN